VHPAVAGELQRVERAGGAKPEERWLKTRKKTSLPTRLGPVCDVKPIGLPLQPHTFYGTQKRHKFDAGASTHR